MKKLIIPVLMMSMACMPKTNSHEADDTEAKFSLIPITSPATSNSTVPNLSLDPDGNVYMSWIEEKDEHAELRFSHLQGDEWSASQLIASGNNWFINWADFPALAVNSQQNMLAHFLARSGDETYAYNIHMLQSDNQGSSWKEKFMPHRDGTKSEHGFVSSLSLADDRFLATWLDGRNTAIAKAPQNQEAYKDASYGMSLRAAVIDQDGKLSEEFELDNRVCDCCQTGAALTAQGPVVVYRNRSDLGEGEEVRDIGIVRYVDGQWTPPTLVYSDNWEISGCPVNGPVATALGDQLAVVWYSAPGNIGRVQVAFSFDAGATFAAPIQVDDLNPLGRVDAVFLDPQTVAISWIERVDKQAEIRLKTVNINGTLSEAMSLTTTSAKRVSGFPQITATSNGLYLAWTSTDSVSMVKTAKVILPGLSSALSQNR